MKTINEILVVGYTHSQPVVLEMHREYIDLALDLLEQTADAVTRSRAAKRALAIADRLATAPRPQADGVKFLRMEASAAVYAVSSGTYRFQSTLPETVK